MAMPLPTQAIDGTGESGESLIVSLFTLCDRDFCCIRCLKEECWDRQRLNQVCCLK